MFKRSKLTKPTLKFSPLRQLSSTLRLGTKDPIPQSQEKSVQNLESTKSSQPTSMSNPPTEGMQSERPSQKTKTVEQQDKELWKKMEGLAGDGGEAGRELEDGQPTAMKRSVRNNMFRYI